MTTELQTYELRGVRLNDVFRDNEGDLWDVVGLCAEPTVIVRNIASGKTEQHVIGCLNWTSKWKHGPLRPSPESGDGS